MSNHEPAPLLQAWQSRRTDPAWLRDSQMAPTNQTRRSSPPWLWIALWAVYSLAVLGYFGYQSALQGLICRA